MMFPRKSRFLSSEGKLCLRVPFRAVKSLFFGLLLRAFAKLFALNRDIITNKSVIIIGPAEGVQHELCDFRLVDYDVFVRMNRGLWLASDPSNGVGTQTDVLFHNFKEEGERSAGQLSPDILDKQNVRFVVYTHAGPSYVPFIARAMMRFRRMGSDANFRVVDPKLYASVSAGIGQFAPLTGTVALALIVACRPRRLGVVGFSFFQTQYHDAYNPTLVGAMAPLDWARDGGSHEPNRDREFVRALLTRAAQDGLEIRLGRNVAGHLQLPVDARR